MMQYISQVHFGLCIELLSLACCLRSARVLVLKVNQCSLDTRGLVFNMPRVLMVAGLLHSTSFLHFVSYEICDS